LLTSAPIFAAVPFNACAVLAQESVSFALEWNTYMFRIRRQIVLIGSLPDGSSELLEVRNDSIIEHIIALLEEPWL
jgi:hypothetical protein